MYLLTFDQNCRYMTDTKRISATSIFFESMPYGVTEKGELQIPFTIYVKSA